MTFFQIVNEIMAGGSFGEMALMSGMNRAATVICIGTSEFLRIDKGDFREVSIAYHRYFNVHLTLYRRYGR